MTITLTLVIYMAIVTWLTSLAASFTRAKAWTRQGTMIMFGNRDNLPEATALAGRAERTARNSAENFMVFAAIAWLLTRQDARVRGLTRAPKSSSGRASCSSRCTTPESSICAPPCGWSAS
jgi:uncharacterized MAPEG superfamily protein